jgi:hypothetical protein
VADSLLKAFSVTALSWFVFEAGLDALDDLLLCKRFLTLDMVEVVRVDEVSEEMSLGFSVDMLELDILCGG